MQASLAKLDAIYLQRERQHASNAGSGSSGVDAATPPRGLLWGDGAARMPEVWTPERTGNIGRHIFLNFFKFLVLEKFVICSFGCWLFFLQIFSCIFLPSAEI